MSVWAKQLIIADKICNVRDLATCAPTDWSQGRTRDYLDWSELVVAGCRGVNVKLEQAFDSAVMQARDALGL